MEELDGAMGGVMDALGVVLAGRAEAAHALNTIDIPIRAIVIVVLFSKSRHHKFYR